MIDKVTICTWVGMNFDHTFRDANKWRRFQIRNTGTWYLLRLRYVDFIYHPLHQGLWIRFNAPKLLHGGNHILVHPNDWEKVLCILEGLIRDTFRWISPPLQQWIVSRIEYPVHYRCHSAEKLRILSALGKLRLDYLRTDTTYMGEGTVYFRNGGRQICAYVKSWEMAKRNWSPSACESMENVMRIEKRYQRAGALQYQIDRIYGEGTKRTLSLCTSTSFVQRVQNEIHSVVAKLTDTMEESEAIAKMQTVGWSRTVISNMMEFLRTIDDRGMTAVHDDSPKQYNRRKHKLNFINIPLLLHQGIHPLCLVEPVSRVEKLIA